MKILYRCILSTLLIGAVSCNLKNENTKTNSEQIEQTQNKISFNDFKKVAGVDNVQEVPFFLYTKQDSIHFYVSPDKNSAYLTVAYSNLENYYGFEEFDDFYSIHYSIQNNLSNSIEAFVLKSEFTASFDLTLKGVNLFEIRSSTYKETNDFDTKSFEKYGTIEEVAEQTFTKASKDKINEYIIQNPDVKIKDNNWVLLENGKENIITQHESISTEDGTLSNTYIGQSPYLNVEIFRENFDENAEQYYSFYSVTADSNFEFFTVSYPHILTTKKWITSVNSNNDIGSDFVITKFISREDQETILYVNFTNFKVADDTKAFWTDSTTFYAEVYPLNATSTKTKKKKPAYVKIKLNKELF